MSRGDRPLRLAYADPPYPGFAELYRGHPDYAGEVDHAELLSRLATFDGWALSTSSAALPAILALAVAQGLAVRVGAWFRRARPHATARMAVWEPVIYAPARRDPFVVSGSERDRYDALVGPSPRRRPTLPTTVIGAKPPAFVAWIFGLLGARPGDEFTDLYPGSGIVGRCWEDFTGRSVAARIHATRDCQARATGSAS